MQRRPISRAGLIAVVLFAAAFAVHAAGSAAIVPPRDCGRLTVHDKRYDIKSDQLRCRTARRYAKRYLGARDRPSGYRCRDFGADTKLKFRCSRGVKVFFAIRR